MPTELTGQLEHITYTNEETGFTIARLKARGHRELITIVGHFAEPQPGEVLLLKGEWTLHPQYGRQFKVASHQSRAPATVDGIRKYLGSGLIRGLGPKMAARIVTRFGARTLEVIEADIGNLLQVDGIGPKRLEMIRGAWQAQQEIRNVMLFLQSHGVGTGHAAKIYRFYANDAIATVRENPFRLATDIKGIGFKTADQIATQLGFAKDAPVRLEAGILYVLNQQADEGHLYLPHKKLIIECEATLSVGRDGLLAALERLDREHKIVIEDIVADPKESVPNDKAVYLTPFHICETQCAQRIGSLMAAGKQLPVIDTAKAVRWAQEQLALRLSPSQSRAVQDSLKHKLLIITGGPGTGKTTIISAILRIFGQLKQRVLLAAPTGRAAKRMSETTGMTAKTIHRLLEFSFQQGGFQRHQDRPLKCNLLIIDEASMIDAVLMHHLLKAVPPAATLVFVGDVNQLPSVGPGNMLNDLIASNRLPVVALKEIFRQAEKSRIVTSAHQINQGQIPLLNVQRDDDDFYFIDQDDPAKVVDLIATLVQTRIPQRFGLDPIDDIQVLTPMHRGLVGAQNLNVTLQNILNPHGQSVQRSGYTYRTGDKVMQIQNDYDKEVYNGDIGRIHSVAAEDQQVVIDFEGRCVTYEYFELDLVAPAYAVSVHKAQGSEYPAVVIPLMEQHYVLLQRNLIYTAITRGKRLVVVVGTRKALAIAVKNDKQHQRYTLLRYRLGNEGMTM